MMEYADTYMYAGSAMPAEEKPSPAYTNKSTSFTMSGKLKSKDLEKLLSMLEDFKQTVSKELENPSNSDVRWQVNMHLGRTG